MNDTEIRLRCIEAAVKVAGNPNTLQQARSFYEFATEAAPTTAAEEPHLSMSQFANKADFDAAKAAQGGKKGRK